MTTLADLVEDVRHQLQAFLEDEEQFATLTAALDASALTLTVDDVADASRGVVEVDDELMLVKTVDPLTNMMTLRARGWAGSSKTTHANGAIVRIHPALPAVQIKRYINQTIEAVYPDLFRKLSNTFDYISNISMYELPADVGEVLTVKFSLIGPSQWWQPAYNWEVDQNANTVAGVVGVFPSGKALWLGEYPTPGQKVQVIYTAAPATLDTNVETLETDSGLPSSTRDVIVYGTCARMLPALEAGRLQTTAIEQSVRAQLVDSGAATRASQYFLALYQERLAEETERLQRLNTITARRSF